jgi:hypothetical protein
MSVPAEKLMELMRGQRSAGTNAPKVEVEIEEKEEMSSEDTPPMGAPMSTPEPKMGSKEGALVNIGMVIDLLEQSLPALGADSEEGKTIMDAISKLNKMLGGRKASTNELQQAEIMQLMRSLPQAGGATPEGRAMAQAPIPGAPMMGALQPPM